jgi:hypothetical protein
MWKKNTPAMAKTRRTSICGIRLVMDFTRLCVHDPGRARYAPPGREHPNAEDNNLKYLFFINNTGIL